MNDMAEIKIPRWKYTPPEGEGLNIDKALMNYESPIEVISKRMRTTVEDGIFNAILEQGISVDKEELIKALRYDREQYEKGFNDGCIGATKEIKREVAREIFAEIYEDCFDQFGYIDYDALDQLKKKYTEGAK